MRNVNSGDEETNSAIQNYIGQIEELNNKLAQAEGKFSSDGSNNDYMYSSSSSSTTYRISQGIVSIKLKS